MELGVLAERISEAMDILERTKARQKFRCWLAFSLFLGWGIPFAVVAVAVVISARK